jgi:hypothetical protein
VLTAVDILLDGRLDGALHGLLGALGLELATYRSGALGIHGALERIALPAEDVVAVLREAVPGRVSVESGISGGETHLSPVLHTKG